MTWRSVAFLSSLVFLSLSVRPQRFSPDAKLCRFVAGRFSDETLYRSYDPNCLGQLSPHQLQRLRESIREASASPQVKALVELVDGRPARAVQRLEEAAAKIPSDAGLLADLSAVQLAAASRTGDPSYRVKALDTADRALAITPAHPAARFNQALALQALFLEGEAKAAWQDYLKLDPTSGWAGEAVEHLETWKQAGAIENWDDPRAVRQSPQAAREYAEETLLGEWALASKAGRPAEARRKLDLARAIGKALMAANGERMVAAAVERIDTVARSDPQRLAVLIAGHSLYQGGLQLSGEGRFTEAKELFEKATASLQRADSPFHLWASFRLAICEMQRFEYFRAQLILRQGAASQYRSLAGRSLWVLGLIHAIQGEPAEALSSYRLALGAFAGIQERDNRAAVYSLAAESLTHLGAFSQAWRSHGQALELSRSLRNPMRRQQLMERAGTTALRGEQPYAALAFLREALRIPTSSSAARLYCLRRMAQVQYRLGQWREARQSLLAARSTLTGVSDQHVREALQGDLLATEGRIVASEDPASAIARLSKAVSLYEETSYSLQLAWLYSERARIYLAAGHRELAEKDLREAIVQIQKPGNEALDVGLRGTYLDHSRTVFDDMIQLQVDLGREEEALNVAESGRAQILRSLFAEARGELSQPVARWRDLAAELADDAAVIEYKILPGRLLIWVIRRQSLKLFQVAVSSENLRSLIQHVRTEILGSSPSLRDDPEARRLFQLLIGTARGSLLGVNRLVLVPDGELFAVPFAALPNDRSGQYLVEQYALATAPSSHLYVEATKRERILAALPSAGVMLVGNPAAWSPTLALSRLPGVAAEIQELHTSSSGSRVLLGPAATKNRFFTALESFDLVHFAGHGIADTSSPASSFLVLAPDGESSGVVYARDLLRLRHLRARLVALSMCSGFAGEDRGGEGVNSLALSLLAAGIPAVVSSLWPLEDRSVPQFFAEFYRHLSEGSSFAASLQQAQLAAIASRDPSISKPAAWAGIQITGTGGLR